jgi:hypothetical protein
MTHWTTHLTMLQPPFTPRWDESFLAMDQSLPNWSQPSMRVKMEVQFPVHSSHISSSSFQVFLQKKKKKRRSRNSPSSMFLFQPAVTLSFLLLSSLFSFFPVLPFTLSLAERHRESERQSERPWDGEKKLSRRPINRFSSSLCRSLSQKPNQTVKKQTLLLPCVVPASNRKTEHKSSLFLLTRPAAVFFSSLSA